MIQSDMKQDTREMTLLTEDIARIKLQLEDAADHERAALQSRLDRQVEKLVTLLNVSV